MALFASARINIEEQVDIFTEALNQIPAFRETGASLEQKVIADFVAKRAERSGNVVVFLDNPDRKPTRIGVHRLSIVLTG